MAEECLPSKCKALNSNSSTEREKERGRGRRRRKKGQGERNIKTLGEVVVIKEVSSS
jgi:hypothetical protein